MNKLTKLYPYFVCFIASLFYVYDYYIQVAPSIMTESLMREFSIGAGKLGLLAGCFYYSYTIMQIPAGYMLDKMGARVLITLAVLASAIGVTLFGVTYSFAIAGIGRFIIGIGASFSFISALFLISRWFSHRQFTVAAGLVQLSGCIGSLIGLAPLSSLVDSIGWRRSMVLTGLVTFGFAIVYWIFIRDGKRNAPVAMPNLPKHASQALKTLLKNRQLWWIAFCGFMSWVPVATVGALWGVPYLMKVYGLGNTDAAKICSLFWVGLGIGSPLVGWISNRLRNRCIPYSACFVLASIGSIILIDATVMPIWMMGIALVFLGLSGSAQSLSFGLVKDIVPPSLFGTASGMNNMAAIIGGAVTQLLVGYLLHREWTGVMLDSAPYYSIENYRIAFMVIPIAALLGLVVASFRIKETFCELQHDEEE